MEKTLFDILEYHNIDGWDKPGGTDKNTVHNYIGTYQNLFAPYKNKKIDLLEIGVAFGGSSLLWQEFFPNARLALLDISDQMDSTIKEKINFSRATYYLLDGYVDSTIHNLSIYHPDGFDIMVEDGPHTLESQLLFIIKYLPILKTGGIMILEDIQKRSHIEILREIVPTEYKKGIEVFDLVNTKGRYDDILFVIRK